MKTIRALSPLLLLLAACATVGRKLDTTHVHDVKSGQRRDQISAWFGAPTEEASFARNAQGCVERWQYTHATATFRASSRRRVLVVDFDDAGAVCDTAYSEVDR